MSNEKVIMELFNRIITLENDVNDLKASKEKELSPVILQKQEKPAKKEKVLKKAVVKAPKPVKKEKPTKKEKPLKKVVTAKKEKPAKVAREKKTIIVKKDKMSGGRDYTKYKFNSEVLSKGRLVLAVVKKYLQDNPTVSANELREKFEDRLQGYFGVVRPLEEVKSKNYKGAKRYFDAPEDVVETSTEKCVVSSQWGVANIENFIKNAKDLGYKIETQK